MKTGIYMIRNKVNNKAYIGQAIDIYARWEQHIRELNNNLKYCNPHLQNAWNKYGADNFEFTIICQCLEQDLDRLEIHYIAHYHTFYKDGNGGYNLTLGGDGIRGYRYTDEQRARRSEQNKEIMNRPEVKAKISRAMNRPEAKKRRSERIKEAMNRPDVRAKMSEVRKGKPKSEEHKAKVGEAHRKAVYCATNNTIYTGVIEAGEKLGIDSGYISYCCNGKNINKKYPDGHHYKKGRFNDSLVYEFWFLSEYEEKFGKVAM